jgi:hypothetical protein
VRSRAPARSRTPSVSAADVSAPTSAASRASSRDSRTDSSNPRPFFTASPSFSRISVWVMKSPRLIFEKKPPRRESLTARILRSG